MDRWMCSFEDELSTPDQDVKRATSRGEPWKTGHELKCETTWKLCQVMTSGEPRLPIQARPHFQSCYERSVSRQARTSATRTSNAEERVWQTRDNVVQPAFFNHRTNRYECSLSMIRYCRPNARSQNHSHPKATLMLEEYLRRRCQVASKYIFTPFMPYPSRSCC